MQNDIQGCLFISLRYCFIKYLWLSQYISLCFSVKWVHLCKTVWISWSNLKFDLLLFSGSWFILSFISFFVISLRNFNEIKEICNPYCILFVEKILSKNFIVLFRFFLVGMYFFFIPLNSCRVLGDYAIVILKISGDFLYICYSDL